MQLRLHGGAAQSTTGPIFSFYFLFFHGLTGWHDACERVYQIRAFLQMQKYFYYYYRARCQFIFIQFNELSLLRYSSDESENKNPYFRLLNWGVLCFFFKLWIDLCLFHLLLDKQFNLLLDHNTKTDQYFSNSQHWDNQQPFFFFLAHVSEPATKLI